jgi:phosphoribosylamine---glycine ligase
LKSEEEARELLKSLPWQGQAGWVLKADGLALGKGVRVCSTLEEALEAVPPLFQLSSTLVIEKRLLGEEVSWMAFCDGTRCSLMEPARDYKRLLDRNEGPNTGGMGAFSPVPEVPDTWYERVQQTVFLPLLTELKRRGAEFRGLLYAGLMVDWKSDQFWVLEFNARFGDPETQVLMPRMADDLFSWCAASARGDLNQFPSRVPFKDEAAVYVVAASSGYPGTPKTGVPIRMEELGKSTCFFSGVELTPEGFVTSGGRVLGTLGQGKDLEKARKNAYSHLSQIYFEGMQFRSDIGKF